MKGWRGGRIASPTRCSSGVTIGRGDTVIFRRGGWRQLLRTEVGRLRSKSAGSSVGKAGQRMQRQQEEPRIGQAVPEIVARLAADGDGLRIFHRDMGAASGAAIRRGVVSMRMKKKAAEMDQQGEEDEEPQPPLLLRHVIDPRLQQRQRLRHRIVSGGGGMFRRGIRHGGNDLSLGRGAARSRAAWR